MKKGQKYIGEVVKYEFPNKGIVEVIEKDQEGNEQRNLVVVKGALKGQKVEFVLNKKRHGEGEGRLINVVEKSYLQGRAPFCPHFENCGGCTYQEMDYQTQINLKMELVKDILKDVIKGEYEYENILGSPYEWGYRNKMEFSFGDEYMNGPLALGLHKKGSFYDIVTVNQCKIVSNDYNVILEGTLKFFKDKNIPYYHKMKHEGYLRHLLIRRSIKNGELLIALVTTSDFAADECMGMTKTDMLESYKNMLLGLDLDGDIKGILHIINDGLADVVRSDRTDILYGDDFITENILGLNFKISTFSFFQTNSLGAEVLYEKARSYVGETKDKVIFDLYSGTGTIAQMLAPVAKKVVGVEIVEEAVEAARENAKLNGLSNCEFIAGDVLKVIGEMQDKPDLIVLDPPREGINPKALSQIIDFGVDRIVYISCKPTSLANDLVMLQERGYKVEKVCTVDMFPQSVHVETCCLLVRECANDDEMVSIKVDLEGISLDQGKFEPDEKPTYGNIKKWIKEKYCFNVTNLYIGQIKYKVGMEKRKNYNIGSGEGRVPTCPPEKEEAIMEAFKHFNLI